MAKVVCDFRRERKMFPYQDTSSPEKNISDKNDQPSSVRFTVCCFRCHRVKWLQFIILSMINAEHLLLITTQVKVLQKSELSHIHLEKLRCVFHSMTGRTGDFLRGKRRSYDEVR